MSHMFRAVVEGELHTTMKEKFLGTLSLYHHIIVYGRGSYTLESRLLQGVDQKLAGVIAVSLNHQGK